MKDQILIDAYKKWRDSEKFFNNTFQNFSVDCKYRFVMKSKSDHYPVDWDRTHIEAWVPEVYVCKHNKNHYNERYESCLEESVCECLWKNCPIIFEGYI